MEIKIMKNILDRNQNKANDVRNLLLAEKNSYGKYYKLTGSRKNHIA